MPCPMSQPPAPIPEPRAPSPQPPAPSPEPRAPSPEPRRRSTMPPMPRTLFEKVWDLHTVRTLPNGQTQLFIGLHLIHEVTTPQAFDMLRDRGLGVRYPDRTFATVDHIVPTRDQRRPFGDLMAEDML